MIDFYILVLVRITLVTLFALFGAWYVRKYDRPDALIGAYVGFVIISNILVYKK